jgi:hypothetical protein
VHPGYPTPNCEIPCTFYLLFIEEEYAIFHIKVFRNVMEVREQESLSCNAVMFTSTEYENKPTFIVYSYNEDITKISYKDVTGDVIAGLTERELTTGSTASESRRKRETTPICHVNELLVPSDLITNQMVGSSPNNFTVIFPDSYNAGICGGSCKTSLGPINTKHAEYVYILLEQVRFTYRYNFKRCCAPIRYGPLDILSRSDGDYKISTIRNMKVKKCECLDIVVH